MKVHAEGGGLFRYESAANMLEGGGKTLILNPMELEEIGFKIVVYLFSLIGVSIYTICYFLYILFIIFLDWGFKIMHYIYYLFFSFFLSWSESFCE